MDNNSQQSEVRTHANNEISSVGVLCALKIALKCPAIFGFPVISSSTDLLANLNK